MLLTPERFYDAVGRLNMSPSTIEIARRALLDGEEFATLARKNGITTQRVSRICATIYKVSAKDNPRLHLGHQILAIMNKSKISPQKKARLREALADLGLISLLT